MFDPIVDNRVRFSSRTKDGHVESYFMKLNSPSAPYALWIRFTIFSPKNQPQDTVAELWAIAFDGTTNKHVAAKRSWKYFDSEAGMRRYPVFIGDSTLGPGYSKGSLEKSGALLEWDFTFTSKCSPMHILPYEAMYVLPVPRSKTLTPYPDVECNGYYRVNGKEYKIEKWAGTQGHNWGKENAFLYAWSHCNLLKDENGTILENTYFEGASTRLKMGRVITPFLSSAWLRIRGVDFPFTLKELRLSDTQAHLEIRRPHRWSFVMLGELGKLSGELSATRAQMVGLYYPNPDGSMTYCLNSKIAWLSLSLTTYAGDKMRFTSESAAFEIGTQDPDHGIDMAV